MRFLGVTETCDLGALYLRLRDAGHEVRVSVEEPLAQGTLANMVPRTPDWRAELDWIRAAGDDGVILFEAVSEGFGALQDSLRKQGFHVVGGSAFGDRLENDRAFAQQLLSDLGLNCARCHAFAGYADAARFLEANPGRYVLKASGAGHQAADTYVGLRSGGGDMLALVAARQRQGASPESLLLMEHIEGVEMGVGAYFDGRRFLHPACLDWEHKRFFPGDLGELTGEMGTVATFDRSNSFFQHTLARIEPELRDAGHVGYVNLNTIVNERGIWPLEFTSRFGYPGYAVLDPLQGIGWAELLAMMTRRKGGSFGIRPGFSVGIVVTTPPFPYSRRQVDEPVGLPVAVDPADQAHIHFGEVGMEGGQLVTSGLYGWTLVVTGTGATIEAARRDAYARVGRISVPNMRYRSDIGSTLADRSYAQVERWGYLDPL